MQSYLRVKQAWSQLAILFATMFGGFVLSMIVTLIMALGKGIPLNALAKLDANDPAMVDFLKTLQAISSFTIFLFPSILFALIVYRKKPLENLGLKATPLPVYYLLGIALMLFSLPLVAWLGELNQLVPLPKSFDEMEAEAGKQIGAFLKVNNAKDIIINFLVIAFIPAICEEALFRGSLQRVLTRLFRNPWIAIIVTALIFSAFHLQFRGFFPRAFFGIMLGCLYWYSGSLWVCIVGHFVVNGIQLAAALYYPKFASENPEIGAGAIISSGVITGLLLYYIIKKSVTYYHTEFPPESAEDFHGFPR